MKENYDEKPKYWCIGDPDSLYTNDIEELLQDFFDQDFCGTPDEIPEKIELIGYDSDEITENDINIFSDDCLENLLQYIDDNFSSARDEGTEPTNSMKEAAKKFVNKIVNEYHVYNCHEVCRKTINVKDFFDIDQFKKNIVGFIK